MTNEDLHKDIRRPPTNKVMYGLKNLIKDIDKEIYNVIVEKCGLSEKWKR
jgi:hypothetical protein